MANLTEIGDDGTSAPEAETPYPFAFCEMIAEPVEAFASDIGGDRLESLIVTRAKWQNATRIHYYFFDNLQTDGTVVRFADGSTRFVSWVGDDTQRALVGAAFTQWKALGIGLDFVEVDDRNEAEVRIGFMPGNGSWSYIGRDVLRRAASERTMNFGWDLRTDDNVALHEIGHTLGMPHEHQNPFAGIVWNEEAVFAALGRPPNSWDRTKTFDNILRKIDAAEVIGSQWDPDSIMHYPFGAGLIIAPPAFAAGLHPAGGLSAADRQWALKFYPGTAPERPITLARSEPLDLASAGQADFVFTAPATRRYTIQTTGISDTFVQIFEEVDGQWRFAEEDDDSGADRNARVQLRLRKGKRYAIRIRMRFRDPNSTPSVIVS